MQEPITVRDTTGLFIKAAAQVMVVEFDWSTKGLASGITIDTSTFTAALVSGPSTTPVTLVFTSPLNIQSGNRLTKVQVSGGTTMAKWKITNTITTAETPPRTLVKWGFVRIE